MAKSDHFGSYKGWAKQDLAVKAILKFLFLLSTLAEVAMAGCFLPYFLLLAHWAFR
jgi:hypothetical protein